MWPDMLVFHEHGELKPIHELAAEHGSVLASLELIKKNGQAGDGMIDTIHKIQAVGQGSGARAPL